MISEQVMRVVDEIALKLGVAAEKVYPMLLKQAETNCAMYRVTLWIAGIALVLLIAAACFFWSEKAVPVAIVVMLVCGTIFMIAGLEAASELKDFVTASVNPEWYAIEYVLDLIK